MSSNSVEEIIGMQVLMDNGCGGWEEAPLTVRERAGDMILNSTVRRRLLTAEQARYLADELHYLAGKIEARLLRKAVLPKAK